MSRERRLLSLLIAYHLAAVTFAALPSPRDLNPVEEIRHPDRGISAWLTPTFDRLALWLSRIQPALFRSSEPVRILTQPYIDGGLRQRWNMFSNPATGDQYLRVDVVVGRPGRAGGASSEPLAYRQLVFPADDESRPRFVHQFRDKAIFNALENHFLRLQRDEDGQEVTAPRIADLRPVSRHFTAAFLRMHPELLARFRRTELWYGTASIPPPGAELRHAVVKDRILRLERYRGTVVPVATFLAGPVIGRKEREGDIVWTLVDVQDRLR
jgi:hypothetical protein